VSENLEVREDRRIELQGRLNALRKIIIEEDYILWAAFSDLDDGMTGGELITSDQLCVL
tara:strand:+ start:17847 stop:18023 length:177 start_codon:yes stop_codon:yes gene_type:complete